jgi:uncharacterized membrane protein YdjX (TVP38/TMEM64 family)
LARLAGFGVLLGTLFVVGLVVAPHSAHRLRHDLDGLGAWGPVAMIGLATLLTCAFVPGPVLAGASGLLFGTALGTGVAIASATLGASAAFVIARRLAQKPYGSFARGRLRDWTTRIGGRGFLAVWYARIAPGAPFALVSYAAGLTSIRLGAFAAGTAIGASPRAFAYAALSGTLGNYTSPKALVAIGVLVAMAIGGGALLWRSRSKASAHRPSASENPLHGGRYPK